MSSLPYTLSVNAQDRRDRIPDVARLRMGARVPVQSGPSPEKGQFSFNYQNVGTDIDCYATIAEVGRYKLNISIDDNLYTGDDASQPARGSTNPVFRQFRISNSSILKDGQTTQFSSATTESAARP